jgi:hypothetical protein
MGCAISSAGFASIGGPPRSAMGDLGPRAVDGADGASVGCSVIGNDTFSVSGRARFECGLVSNPTQPGSTCGLSGELVFENGEQR